jgi:formiminotetrahydrofolate cyclodeaminase
MSGERKFREMRIEDFLTLLSSDSPTPGGGTVSALAGALGSALLKMVCSITLKKSEMEELRILREKAENWGRELTELMDLDSEAFDEVISAFSLPKNTDEEKEIRSAKIQEAFKKASEVPLKTAKLCNIILNELGNIKEKINPNVMSDWKVASFVVLSGMLGGISNVEINLPSIKDEKFKEKMMNEIKNLKENIKEKIDNILKD